MRLVNAHLIPHGAFAYQARETAMVTLLKSTVKRLLEGRAIPKRARKRPRRAFWGSGRSDISERLEDIIYGPRDN